MKFKIRKAGRIQKEVKENILIENKKKKKKREVKDTKTVPE